MERFGKFHAVLDPGLSLLIPLIDEIKYVHTLKEVVIEIPSQAAITQDNVTMQLDGVLYVKVRCEPVHTVCFVSHAGPPTFQHARPLGYPQLPAAPIFTRARCVLTLCVQPLAHASSHVVFTIVFLPRHCITRVVLRCVAFVAFVRGRSTTRTWRRTASRTQSTPLPSSRRPR